MSRLTWTILFLVITSAAAMAVTIGVDDLDPFEAPWDLTVTELVPGGDRSLTWTSISGASYYKVGRINCDEDIERLVETSGTSYTDANYDSNECYEYVVIAYDSSDTKICSAHVEDFGSCPCP